MAKFVFPPLGPPSKQPRKTFFSPKINRRGSAKINPSLAHEKIEDDASNMEELEEFGVQDVDNKNVPVLAGEVIIAAKPFVYVLSTSCRGTRCDHCMTRLVRETSLRCDCNFSYFCSKECQTNDKVHAKECQFYKARARNPTNDTVRYVLRAILIIQDGGIFVGDKVPGLNPLRRFEDLVDHFDDISTRCDYRRELVEQCYLEIVDFLGKENCPDPDYFLTIYGRIAVNSFSIVDWEEQESIGSGLYLGPSIFDHSCQPNAAVTFMPDKTIVVRALEDFDERDYSQMFITYIDLVDHRKHRREHLLKHYYFQCQCQRCLDQSSEDILFSVICKSCKNPTVTIHLENKADDSPVCRNCSAIYLESDVESYFEMVEIVQEKLNDTVVPMDVANFCILQMERRGFGPNHIFMIQANVAAFESYIWMFEKKMKNNQELLKKARDAGIFLVEAYHKMRRKKVWPCYGLLLFKLAHVELKLNFKESASSHLKEAEEILQIAYGKCVHKDYLSGEHQI